MLWQINLWEDLLQLDAKEVDSTNDPAKKGLKFQPLKGKKGKEKSKKLARVAAAQARAKSMFFHEKSDSNSDSDGTTETYCKS